MTKRKAKRLAYRWVIKEIDRAINRDECDDEHDQQVKAAVHVLRGELVRRALGLRKLNLHEDPPASPQN